MPINDYFIFDGKNSLDYGLYMASDPNAVHPARRGELFPIPGRNGSIVREDGSYDTYTVTYDVLLDSKDKASDVYAHAREVAAWLLGSRGFCRLEDSYEPEYFRLARCAAQMSVENRLARFGRAQIPFEVQPQRYLKSGESSFSLWTDDVSGQIKASPIPKDVEYVNVTGTVAAFAAEFRDADGEKISDINGKTAVPTNAVTIVASWTGTTSDSGLQVIFTDASGAEYTAFGISDGNPVIINPTQFEARPLLKFTDTSGDPPAPVAQTLTNVNDTYIGSNGIVLKTVWASDSGKYYTTQAKSTSGYDYAIITAKAYTFLDSNRESVGFAFGNFKNKKVIIPTNAVSVVLGNDIGKSSALSLQAAPENPGASAATINGTTISLDFSAHDTIYLDCDLHDAYYIDGSSANSAVSFASNLTDYPTFPGLVPGENVVVVGTSENLDFELVPRWWTV